MPERWEGDDERGRRRREECGTALCGTREKEGLSDDDDDDGGKLGRSVKVGALRLE